MGKRGLGGIIKQAQEFQEKMAQIQEELEQKKVEGSAGGGMVTVVVNGKQDVLSVRIDPEVVDPDDVEMLEDLVVAAIKQARERAQELAEEEMQRATTGLMPMLGGMITPRLGEVVIRPRVYFSLYPFSMRAGIMKPPNATTVATVEPDMAPNRPQAMTPAMPNPPGSQLTNTFATLMSLSTMVPAVIILPQSMKYRTTTRANLSILRNRL